jgi:hypothetical protein
MLQHVNLIVNRHLVRFAHKFGIFAELASLATLGEGERGGRGERGRRTPGGASQLQRE